MLQMRSWGRGSGGGAPGSATIVAKQVAKQVATPFSGSSRRELTMSQGRAREAADDDKVRVGRPPQVRRTRRCQTRQQPSVPTLDWAFKTTVVASSDDELRG